MAPKTPARRVLPTRSRSGDLDGSARHVHPTRSRSRDLDGFRTGRISSTPVLALAVFTMLLSIGTTYYVLFLAQLNQNSLQDSGCQHSTQVFQSPTALRSQKKINQIDHRQKPLLNDTNTLTDTVDVPRSSDEVPIHMVQVGPERQATTVQFQCVCLSLFLKLYQDSSQEDNGKKSLVDGMRCRFSGFGKRHPVLEKAVPSVFKIHSNLPKSRDDQAADWSFSDVFQNTSKAQLWVFATASNPQEANLRKELIQNQMGYPNVMHMQDLRTLEEKGAAGIVRGLYGPLFGLSTELQNELIEYLRYWDIIRRCCGKQMSGKWRNEQFPVEKQANDYNRTAYLHSPAYHGCPMYDMNHVESMFIQTPLYQRIMAYPRLKAIARPSTPDSELDGTYCSRYNEAVRTQGLRAMQGLPRKPQNNPQNNPQLGQDKIHSKHLARHRTRTG